MGEVPKKRTKYQGHQEGDSLFDKFIEEFGTGGKGEKGEQPDEWRVAQHV